MIDKDGDTAIRIEKALCCLFVSYLIEQCKSNLSDVKDFKRCHRACSKFPTVYARGVIAPAIDARLASARFLPRLTSYSRSTRRTTY